MHMHTLIPQPAAWKTNVQSPWEADQPRAEKVDSLDYSRSGAWVDSGFMSKISKQELLIE